MKTMLPNVVNMFIHSFHRIIIKTVLRTYILIHKNSVNIFYLFKMKKQLRKNKKAVIVYLKNLLDKKVSCLIRIE